MRTIQVTDEEFTKIIEERISKEKRKSNLIDRFSKDTLESMLFHMRSEYASFVLVKPGSKCDGSEGFYTTSNVIKFGYIEPIYKKDVEEYDQKLTGIRCVY